MEAAAHPLQERRLRALHDYEILDTDRERDFDDIVQLASAICDTPISVINFIDAERQWFKAETGLGVRETPLDTSICSHVILQDAFTEIEDTLQDARMADNPLCCGDPGLRFYAGALLTTASGLPIGTLCVLDYRPRVLTSLQRDTLRVLARQVMAQLDLRKALRAAVTMRKEVDHRVKNSLQSLSSFIRVQGRSVTTPEATAAMEAINSRMEAVSTLHEHLYSTGSAGRVDLGAYVRRLGEHLRAIAPEGIGLDVAAEPVSVSAREAGSAGTLINEFVTNAFKHAFPEARSGQVRVSVTQGAGGAVRVACRDDGSGWVADRPDGDGLGLTIAQVACMELDCDLDMRNTASGVEAAFEFQPQPVAEDDTAQQVPEDVSSRD